MRVFIGSSGEQRHLVDWLTAFIRERYPEIIPVPWTAPWRAGGFTLETLQDHVEKTDGSILFLTPDDPTLHRGTERTEPRDNLLLEAGLFISGHGRYRTHLMVPQEKGGAKVSLPSDIAGLTWHPYAWAADTDIEATGLPQAARNACDQLLSSGPRQRKSVNLAMLSSRTDVETGGVVVAEWRTGINDGIIHLIKRPEGELIDLLASYRVGEIRRHLDEFRKRDTARLRACFSDFWDEDLAKAYQRKYTDREPDYMRGAVKDSIEKLLGPCTIEGTGGSKVVSAVRDKTAATFEIYLTRQRITYGYHRVDTVALITPLDMKVAQDPAPLTWAIDQETMPITFAHYEREYEQILQEARRVYPA